MLLDELLYNIRDNLYSIVIFEYVLDLFCFRFIFFKNLMKNIGGYRIMCV